MWEYILGCLGGAVVIFCCSAKWIMRKSWDLKKDELEELKLELEKMEELTEELKEQKKEIEELLNNEFKDFDYVWSNAVKKE